jgi:hypothetical protein
MSQFPRISPIRGFEEPTGASPWGERCILGSDQNIESMQVIYCRFGGDYLMQNAVATDSG